MSTLSDFIKWLKEHWFILVAVASGATAWANQQNKIDTVAQRQAQLEQTREEIRKQTDQVQTIKETAIRQDEQIKSLNRQLESQNVMIRILLESDPRVQRWIKQNNVIIPDEPTLPNTPNR